MSLLSNDFSNKVGEKLPIRFNNPPRISTLSNSINFVSQPLNHFPKKWFYSFYPIQQQSHMNLDKLPNLSLAEKNSIELIKI